MKFNFQMFLNCSKNKSYRNFYHNMHHARKVYQVQSLTFLQPQLITEFHLKNIHTSLCLEAGHSKWQNIKHIKALKDKEKSIVAAKYVNLIKIACKEQGGTNPDHNTKLARVISLAKSFNIAGSTIDNAIKQIEKAEDNSKASILIYSAPGGMFIVVDIFTDNVNRTKHKISSLLKKINFKEIRQTLDTLFNEEGIIVTTGDLNKAVDHAIEVGAEDVTLEDGLLKFTCSAADFEAVRRGIEQLNYDIQYSNIDRIPIIEASVKDSDLVKFRTIFDRVKNDVEEVVSMDTNFDNFFQEDS